MAVAQKASHASCCSQQWWSNGCTDRLFFFLPFTPQHTPPLPRWHAPMASAYTLLFPERGEVSLLVYEPDARRMSNPSKSTGEAAKAGASWHHLVQLQKRSAYSGWSNLLMHRWMLNCTNPDWSGINNSSDCRNKDEIFLFFYFFPHHFVLDLIGKCTSNSKSAYD